MAVPSVSKASAIGMIETVGIPAAIEAGDAMCKAAQVTLIGYENTDLGRITVIIRGNVAEVQTAIAAGLCAVTRVNGGEILSHHIIARPDTNLEFALPIGHGTAIDLIQFPPPLSP